MTTTRVLLDTAKIDAFNAAYDRFTRAPADDDEAYEAYHDAATALAMEVRMSLPRDGYQQRFIARHGSEALAATAVAFGAACSGQDTGEEE